MESLGGDNADHAESAALREFLQKPANQQRLVSKLKNQTHKLS